MPREQLQSLTEQMFYLLLVLNKENFGYKIMEDVKVLTSNRVIIGPGTLYALLSRFEELGYIKQTSEVDRRKLYLITSTGKLVLDKEYQRIKAMYLDGRKLEE